MQREITLRFLAEPTEVNFGGKVHGGIVMKWIDQAGYTCAVGWSGKYCVTVYVGGIRFLQPIRIGDLVEVKAKIIRTGTSSMQIAVDVYARDPKSQESERSTRCIIVFVAVDEEGKPTPVKRWEPVTENDKALTHWASKLMEMRMEIESEVSGFWN